MLKRAFLFLPLLLLAANILMAQDDELPPPSSKPKEPPANTIPNNNNNNDFSGFSKPKKVDFSKFIIEPDFELNLQPGEVDIGVSPYVGHQVWKDLYAGGGVTYFYTGITQGVTDQFGNIVGNAKATFHTYGGGVFLQYNIWHGIFARAKFEVLERNVSNIDKLTQRNPTNPADGFYFPRMNLTYPDLLVGVGYNLLRSKNFFFPIMVSYNVLQGVGNPEYAVYPHAWVIQLGFINIF